MSFVWEQLQQLGMVAIIMACALGGTAGLLKIMKKITPGDGFPQDPISKKRKEKGEHLND